MYGQVVHQVIDDFSDEDEQYDDEEEMDTPDSLKNDGTIIQAEGSKPVKEW